jgi:hypothetical protein
MDLQESALVKIPTVLTPLSISKTKTKVSVQNGLTLVQMKEKAGSLRIKRVQDRTKTTAWWLTTTYRTQKNS